MREVYDLYSKVTINSFIPDFYRRIRVFSGLLKYWNKNQDFLEGGIRPPLRSSPSRTPVLRYPLVLSTGCGGS